ncbi:LuxR C-terminal-related transcriptional regulator [Cupriavidus sp. CuC1]|uniref:LuxR C-terminal-related transcriptional regulator n=1 Tax=Cupriavidus sp. CuC1 TaxID=3373131 RepID=UPI0037D792AF
MKRRPRVEFSISESEVRSLLVRSRLPETGPATALRLRIVTRLAQGLSSTAVAAELGISEKTVVKWRGRFLARGEDGLLDAPRQGAPRRIDNVSVANVITHRLSLDDATSTREVARQTGVSQSTVARIWRATGLSGARHEGKSSGSARRKTRAPSHIASGDERDSEASDLMLAFYMAPVGLMVSRQRVVHTYNGAFGQMFGYEPKSLVGKSLEALYPTPKEFEHIGERALLIMRDTGVYSDERIMRRANDSLFWCHVSGRAIDRADPFAAAVWTFEDLSSVRKVTADLTSRERQIAQLLVNGNSSKQIGRELAISPRTVEGHRARLMLKYGVQSSSELIAHLIGRVI